MRKYLEEHKWHITDEKMLIDMNKFYTIIKAEKGQESYPIQKRNYYMVEYYLIDKMQL